MAFEVKLRALGFMQGDYLETATIVKWYKKEREFVEEGEPLVEVEAAKATAVIKAPISGVIKKIFYKEDTDVQLDETIAIIEEV